MARTPLDEYLLANDFLGGPEAIASAVQLRNTGGAGSSKSKTASKAKASSKTKSSSTRVSSNWAKSDTYKVKRGDTLWGIAERVRQDRNLSVEQVVLAIFRTNKHAFFENNSNNLKAGKVLKLPERDVIEGVNRTKAHKEFRAQYDSWQEYKLKLASASNTITVPDQSGQATKNKPKTASKPKSKPKVAKAEPKVAPKPKVKPKTKPESKKEALKLPEKPAPKTEKTESKQPETPKTIAPDQDGGVPADDLLKIVRANLESKKAAQQQAVPDSEASGKDTAVSERSKLAERADALDESLASKEMETKDIGERVGKVNEQLDNQKRLLDLENTALAKNQAENSKSKPVVSEGKPATEAKPKLAPKPAPKVAPKPPKQKAPKLPRAKPPAPTGEKSFISTLMDDYLSGQSLMMLLAIPVVLVGGWVLLVYMRRRSQATAEFEESILNTSSLDGDDLMTGEVGADTSDAGDTSFLSDFSQGGMGNIHTDEVDPIAEAEVYLAYGRDEQAEEILKEAVIKDPNRHQLREKLLEIYHQRNDIGAFETLAEELYAALEGRGGDLWDRVAGMGKTLNPDNPMFTGEGVPAGMASAAPTDMDMLDMETTEEGDQGLDMDMDLDMGMGEGEAENSGLDFTPAEAASGDGGLDMGAGLDLGADLESSGDDENSAIDFNLDGAGLDFESSAADEGLSLDSAGDMSLDEGLSLDSAGDSTEGGLDFASDEGLSLDAGADDSGLSFESTDEGLSFDAGADDGLSLDAVGGDEGLSLEGIADDGLSLEAEGEDSGIDFGLESADVGGAEELAATELVDSGSSNEEITWDNDDLGGDEAGGDLALDMDMGAENSELVFEDDDTDSSLSFDSSDLDSASGELAFDADEGGVAVEAVAGDDAGGQPQWDETATKLDLARAYIDMGDAEGARSILDEVMAEGNEQQKQEAADLAAQIT